MASMKRTSRKTTENMMKEGLGRPGVREQGIHDSDHRKLKQVMDYAFKLDEIYWGEAARKRRRLNDAKARSAV